MHEKITGNPEDPRQLLAQLAPMPGDPDWHNQNVRGAKYYPPGMPDIRFVRYLPELQNPVGMAAPESVAASAEDFANLLQAITEPAAGWADPSAQPGNPDVVRVTIAETMQRERVLASHDGSTAVIISPHGVYRYRLGLGGVVGNFFLAGGGVRPDNPQEDNELLHDKSIVVEMVEDSARNSLEQKGFEYIPSAVELASVATLLRAAYDRPANIPQFLQHLEAIAMDSVLYSRAEAWRYVPPESYTQSGLAAIHFTEMAQALLVGEGLPDADTVYLVRDSAYAGLDGLPTTTRTILGRSPNGYTASVHMHKPLGLRSALELVEELSVAELNKLFISISETGLEFVAGMHCNVGEDGRLWARMTPGTLRTNPQAGQSEVAMQPPSSMPDILLDMYDAAALARICRGNVRF